LWADRLTERLTLRTTAGDIVGFANESFIHEVR
jgi:hypothetical protein